MDKDTFFRLSKEQMVSMIEQNEVFKKDPYFNNIYNELISKETNKEYIAESLWEFLEMYSHNISEGSNDRTQIKEIRYSIIQNMQNNVWGSQIEDLPSYYGIKRLDAILRDPEWVWVFWEIPKYYWNFMLKKDGFKGFMIEIRSFYSFYIQKAKEEGLDILFQQSDTKIKDYIYLEEDEDIGDTYIPLLDPKPRYYQFRMIIEIKNTVTEYYKTKWFYVHDTKLNLDASLLNKDAIKVLEISAKHADGGASFYSVDDKTYNS